MKKIKINPDPRKKPIGSLEFYYKEDMINALNAQKYRVFIDEIYEKFFRPHFKHDVPIVGNKLTAKHLEVLDVLWMDIKKEIEELK